jgi:hypothetical protein
MSDAWEFLGSPGQWVATGGTHVSCSPFRVPIARLAAAQAQMNFPRD